MDFSFSEEQETLRRDIVAFCKRELGGEVGPHDRAQEFPRALWDKCGAMGLQGLPVPEDYGGVGLDALTTAIALEAFGYGCSDGGLVFSVCAHLLACVVPIWKHGSEAQKHEWLPDLCSGRKIAVNAMSEPQTGSDAFAMQTRAVREPRGYRITGAKTFASNGPVADVAVVYAATAAGGYHGGVSVFVVERGSGGFEPGQKFEKMGLRTAPIGELVFDDVYVPESARIGAEGAGGQVFQQSMEWERVCLVTAHVGTMQRLLETAVEYARTRRAYGQPIGKFQAVAHRIADMMVRLEAARLLVYRSAARLGAGGRAGREVGMDAAATKLFVSEALVRSALDAVRVLGGYGFMAEYEVERALRDAVGGGCCTRARRMCSGTSSRGGWGCRDERRSWISRIR